MQRRRLLSLTAAGLTTVLSVATLSACGGSSPLSGDTTIHMIAADYGDPKTGTSSKAYWDQISQAFEAQNPKIKVDVEVVDWLHVDDKIAALAKAGKAPDLAQAGSYSDYAAAGQLYSADELFPISMQANFLSTAVSAGSVNRVQYGIPWVSSSRLFFYNKKLFREAGIKHAPQTWAEVKADAIKLKNDGVSTPYGLPLGTEEAQAESLIWMLGASGGYTDTVGSYTFDSAANISAFTWLKNNLVAPGLIGSGDPAKTNRQNVFDQFLAGKAGMINGHPTLLTQAKAKGIDVGVAPLPGLVGPSRDTLGVADWMMAFKQNGHRDADGKFLQFVYSDQNSLKFLNEYGLLPVTTSVLQTMLKDPKEKDFAPFLNAMPEAVFYPVNKISWGPVSDQVKKSIGKAVHGDPKQVLSDLQRFAMTTNEGK